MARLHHQVAQKVITDPLKASRIASHADTSTLFLMATITQAEDRLPRRRCHA